MAAHQSTSSTFTTASGTKTATLGALAAGEMVFVVVANTGSTALPTVTDDNPDGLGAYTAIAGPILKATSADRMYLFARNALVGNTASTIITMAPGATSGGGLSASRWTGFTRVGAALIRSITGTPQVGKQDNQAAATAAPALPAACLTTNPTIGVVFNATNPPTFTATASWTERFDNGFNTPTTGMHVQTRDSGFTGTTVTWGTASGSAFCSMIVELDASVAGQTVAVGRATQTSTAQPVGKLKSRSIGQAAGTTTAQSLTMLKRLAIGQAVTTATAQPVSLGRRRMITQPGETDAAQPVTGRETKAIGQAATTNTAQPVTFVRAIAIGQASELDRPGGTSVTITDDFNIADQAALGGDLAWTEYAASAADTAAWSIVSNRANALASVSVLVARAEHELGSVDHYAQATYQVGASDAATNRPGVAVRINAASDDCYVFRYRKDGGNSDQAICKRVGGTDTKLTGAPASPNPPLVAGDVLRLEVQGTTLRAYVNGVLFHQATDASITTGTRAGLYAQQSGASRIRFDDFSAGSFGASTLTAFKAKGVAQASELDTATAGTARRARAIAQSLETDAAQALSSTATVATGRALETDAAQLLTASKRKAVEQTAELDTAAAAAPSKQRMIGETAEVDTAQPTISSLATVVGQASEADTAAMSAARKAKGVGLAPEADTASVFTGRKIRQIAQALEDDEAQPVTRSARLLAVALASELDTGAALRGLKTRTVGHVAELDTASPVAAVGFVDLTRVITVGAAWSDELVGAAWTDRAADAGWPGSGHAEATWQERRVEADWPGEA